ncbi:MAG: bifunctional phosphopantothenoylcysteine decarboxylase/phosphopantothenate--cysteine ligase CoaBC [Atopobiaceae bacterium]|nr:bifunctional phosphopantothenoylcysteine decarboxylase/phosphopantothenate--cysteine ligase CoaBC [Atopobiaceae bacterium]
MEQDKSAQHEHVLIGISAGIAAYKACEVIRGLQKAGCDVRAILSPNAQHFVGKDLLEGLTGEPVTTDVFDSPFSPSPHLQLTSWADLFIVCPCTTDIMAKACAGIGDDVLTTALLAADSPVLMTPAMNTRMWANPATQANYRTLLERGIHVLTPDSGRLICGDVGTGKLPAVDDIVAEALRLLRGSDLLRGKRVVVTAGPTHEAIDPVRYISNASSGKMGYAIARALVQHGAEVVLVSGPVALDAPTGVELVPVVSARDMYEASVAAFESADAAICAAAVADYRPKEAADSKLKKDKRRLESVELVENPDILATLSKSKGERVVVGFAAETENAVENGRAKLERKGCDMIVANDVSQAESTFGSDTNRVVFVTANDSRELELMSKDDVAYSIVEKLAELMGVTE